MINTSDSDSPSTFESLGIDDSQIRILNDLGYEQPSAIQAKAIPPFIQGKDILGLAQTGTGKTAAFALPILKSLDVKSSDIQALVLTPTRELAIQVSEAFQSYAKGVKGFHVIPIYGGTDMRGQLRQLKRGVQVIVGTPGRVMDHMRRKSIRLDHLKTLVLDEADEMLRMGFIDDVEWVLQQTPDTRQLALFSATMPPAIERITGDYLKDPCEIKIESATRTVEKIKQSYAVVNNNRKLDALTRILELDGFDAAIVFVRTKTSTMDLAQRLEARGFSSAAINGDLSQQQRELTLNNLRKGNIDILVATDVAARGIDVARISLVVNYDIPYDGEAYVHRIGRTGRAGREGRALLFVTPRERRLLKMIERSSGHPIAHEPIPSDEDLSAARIYNFRQRLMQVLENEPLDGMKAMIDSISNETGVSIEEMTAGFAHMAQENKPLRVEAQGNLNAQGKAGKESSQGDKRDRKDRRESKSGKAAVARDMGVAMDIYELSVGDNHGVAVKDILGAVANELAIDSEYIGQIRIDQDNSYIELPEGMPKELQQAFKKLRIRGNPAEAKKTKSAVDMSKRLSKDSTKSSRGKNKRHQDNPRRREKPDSSKKKVST